MTLAPLTEFHTCDACGCAVPIDRYADRLQAQLRRVLTQLRECRQRMKGRNA